MIMQDYADQVSEVTPLPLVVDLDGTLIKTDLLYESYFNSASLGLSHPVRCLKEACKGRAPLKEFLALGGELNYAAVPYDEVVLDLIRSARDEGRPVYLATASDRRHAAAIAAHLGLFDGVFASEGKTNLSSAVKARVLVKTFGRGGFDYAGNGPADLAVWAEARKAYAIRTSERVEHALDRMGMPVERLTHPGASLRVWIKAIRVHQYAKNTLVFVPLLTAHVHSIAALLSAVLAFAAFCACASGVYIINDLVDLEADRLHPRKRHRPFASGAIPIGQATMSLPVLLVLSAICALSGSLAFTGVVLAYFALTTAYSLSLKRKMLIDAVVLAMLYAVRVVGGAVAIDVFVSEWLLGFSMFIFLSLALMKRYVELM